MSVVVNLPPELDSFISMGGGQSLLIRGPPGTGKSTLALALLDSFPGRGTLLSTRVSRDLLARQFAWLGRSERAFEVVDASKEMNRMDEYLPGSPVVAQQMDPSMGGWHSPGLELLSTPLSHVLASQSALEPAMVVIDSWDALVERMTPDPSPTNGVLSVRQQLDRTIIDRFSAAGTLLTIVVEREERTELDYLVDAVVTTRLETPDERVERWLSLSKLRGVRIGNPQYPFTLEGGKFRCLTPTSSDLRVLESRPAADPSPGASGLWPGNPTFAGCFGRLPWNGVSLLELSSHTPDELTRTFTWTAGVHVVSEGGRVFAILPPTMSTVALWDALKTWVEPGHFCKHTRLLAAVDPSEYPTEIADSAVRTTDWKVSAPDATGAPSRSGSVGPNLPGIHRFLRVSGDMGRPVLVIVYLEGLELAGRLVGVDYAPSSFPALVQAYSRIPRSHVMVVGRTGDPLLESIKPLAAVNVRFNERQGRIFCHGVRPRTPTFVLTEAPGDHGSTRAGLLEVA
jgi:KaiC/GvpD/RAD55 family RecA-like ATPase